MVAQLDIMENKIIVSPCLSIVLPKQSGYKPKKYASLRVELVRKELTYQGHLVNLTFLVKMGKLGILAVFFVYVPIIQNGMENAAFLVQEEKFGKLEKVANVH